MNINYKVQTNKSFEKTVEDLKESLGKHNFGVLWELNMMDKLNEKGLDFNKNIKVFEVCNPIQAKKILDINIEAGYFLPCKIIVFEDQNSVFIGMPRPTELIGMIRNDDLGAIAAEVEDELKSAIYNSK